ncbi:hypothetical protein EBU24_05805, partial [bacterium]|nr:hypothetical protein [bacterium]
SSSLTGSYIAQDNLQRMADALQGSLETRLLSKHPVFGHIDLLIHMHEKFLTRTLTDDLKTGIANPLVLIKCVKQLTNLISDFTESQQSTFISEQDKETCIKMLSDIAHELERNQQVIQWLVDPKSSTTLLSEYKKATEQLKRVLNEHNKEHFETRIRTEMKDRLRSIAQAELATLSYMIPPAFPKLKAQLIAFDASMHTVIKSIQDNYWTSSWHPLISRSRKLQYEQYAIRCDFSNSLKEVPGIEEDARRDDFISYIDHIIESKKIHLERIRKDIEQKIEDKLKQNMMHINTLDFNNLSWMPTVIHSIVYPAQKDKFHLPLFLPNTLDAPQQIKTMIATGKATLTYTYNVAGKEIIVSGHLHYNDTKEEVYKWVSSEHTEVIENDEDLYNFIYGGRYAYPNDTITVYHGPGTPEYDAWEGCDCLETRSFVNTHRYPSLVEHPGLYTKNTGFMARQLHEDMSKNLTHKNAIDTYLAEKRSEQSRAAVQMLDDQTTELGKAGNKFNIFYALLASSLAMHDGKLEPHATITQSTNTEARNSQELRTLLRDNPTQVPAALTTLSALTTQPVTFNGTHKLLIKQTDYLEKIRTALTQITQTPVHIPAAPKSLASALPEEFMKEISARFTTLETENRELKAQNAQVLAQNAQILALLMAINEKK